MLLPKFSMSSGRIRGQGLSSTIREITRIKRVVRREAGSFRYGRKHFPFVGAGLVGPLFVGGNVSMKGFRMASTYVTYGQYRGIYPVLGVIVIN